MLECMSNSDFKGASDYDKTTYGTWDISMQTIEMMVAKDVKEESVAAQSAIKILRIVAFLVLQHTDSTLCIADTSDRPVLFSLPIYRFTLR